MCETHNTKKIHAIAQHQPPPAQHLPATYHSRIISNTLIHTPPETRQAFAIKHHQRHPGQHPTQRLSSHTHNQPPPTNIPPTQSHITGNTPSDHHQRHPNTLCDTSHPIPRSSTTINSPTTAQASSVIRHQHPAQHLLASWSGTTNDTP